MSGTAKIAANSVVSIDYRLTDDEGELLDSSAESAPLAYLHGHGQIVDGLERELTGKGVGDTVQIRVTPEDGYGFHEEKLVIKVPREQLDFEPEAGMVLLAQDPHGGSMPFKVVAVDQETVTLDGNHPLAGKSLNFDVKVVEVRQATEEELAHGHAHTPGSHHH